MSIRYCDFFAVAFAFFKLIEIVNNFIFDLVGLVRAKAKGHLLMSLTKPILIGSITLKKTVA